MYIILFICIKYFTRHFERKNWREQKVRVWQRLELLKWFLWNMAFFLNAHPLLQIYFRILILEFCLTNQEIIKNLIQILKTFGQMHISFYYLEPTNKWLLLANRIVFHSFRMKNGLAIFGQKFENFGHCLLTRNCMAFFSCKMAHLALTNRQRTSLEKNETLNFDCYHLGRT
jgi:hypothetical protein